MVKLHHRMPVTLQANEFDTWFESDDLDEIDCLMQPANEDWIRIQDEYDKKLVLHLNQSE